MLRRQSLRGGGCARGCVFFVEEAQAWSVEPLAHVVLDASPRFGITSLVRERVRDCAVVDTERDGDLAEPDLVLNQ